MPFLLAFDQLPNFSRPWVIYFYELSIARKFVTGSTTFKTLSLRGQQSRGGGCFTSTSLIPQGFLRDWDPGGRKLNRVLSYSGHLPGFPHRYKSFLVEKFYRKDSTHIIITTGHQKNDCMRKEHESFLGNLSHAASVI